ncbi:MAG: exosortase C-terminal domain/associated protein EpsI [Candidatus Omnitrophota bacterium]|jgi:EpsI family protein
MFNKLNKNFMVLLGLFFFAGVVSWTLYFKEYQQKDSVNIQTFPQEIAGWKSEELPITDREYEILETRNAFTRKYTNAQGDSVYLFIVYSQTNRKVVHPPEICYTGGGATFISNVHHTIDVPQPKMQIISNKYLVEQGGYRQYMCYWFKVGNTFTPNYLKGQTLIAMKRLTGQPSSGALIRISAVVDPENPDKAMQLIDAFSRIITPQLFQCLP